MLDVSDPPAPTTVALRPPRNRVERRAVTLWTLNSLVAGMAAVGGLGLTFLLVESIRAWTGPALVVSTVVAVVTVAVMPTARYVIHRWEYTDRAVYSLQGWLIRQWRVAPLSRVQTVDTVKGPFEQLLGLATLKVTTASREGGIRIRGLDAATAAEAARALTEITQRSPGDAT